MTLSIDMSDPGVQRMLHGEHPLAPRPQRSVVQLAGDVPDPTGLTARRGFASTTRLTAGKHEVVVVYGDTFLTVDVYQVPGEPLMVHLYCPRCHKHATVRGDAKAIDFDPTARNPQRTAIVASGDPSLVALADRGRISIEAFECPWEMGEDRHVAGGVHTGASLCRQRLAIENCRAKDA